MKTRLTYLRPLLFLLLVTAAAACSPPRAEKRPTPAGAVQLKNNILKKAIQDYVAENSLDCRTNVVTVVFLQHGDDERRQRYLIANTITDPFRWGNPPFAYTKVGVAWVLFFQSSTNPFESQPVRDGFAAASRPDGVALVDKLLFHNPPSVVLEITDDTAATTVKR
jgi:hypothetical protein